MGAAREKVRVAHCLEYLPLIDASFATGEISYSKVRAMTRVATPETEEALLVKVIEALVAPIQEEKREQLLEQRLQEEGNVSAGRFHRR